MKKKTSIIIIIIVLILVIIGLLSISTLGKDKKEKINVIENKNKEVIKNQKFENLDFTNVSLTYVKEKGSTFTVTVKNNTESIININGVDIILKDKDGNIITTLYGFLGGNIEPEQENLIKATAKEDLSKTVSVEYKVSDLK